MASVRRRCATLGVAACTMCSCGSPLPEIPKGPHPTHGGAEPIVVDRAPPPARIDEIGPRPALDCRWSDGTWKWQDNSWVWQPGQWVRVDPGCYFAEPILVWVPAVSQHGVLFYTHGQWYQTGGTGLCVAPVACSARSSNRQDAPLP